MCYEFRVFFCEPIHDIFAYSPARMTILRLGRTHERGPMALVAGFNVGPVLYQKFHNFHMIILRRVVERRLPRHVGHARICPSTEEELDAFKIPIRGVKVQRRLVIEYSRVDQASVSSPIL